MYFSQMYIIDVCYKATFSSTFIVSDQLNSDTLFAIKTELWTVKKFFTNMVYKNDRKRSTGIHCMHDYKTSLVGGH